MISRRVDQSAASKPVLTRAAKSSRRPIISRSSRSDAAASANWRACSPRAARRCRRRATRGSNSSFSTTLLDGVAMLLGLAPFEGIDVGIDRRSPVHWRNYEHHGAFPYSGHLLAVTYTPGEQPSYDGSLL